MKFNWELRQRKQKIRGQEASRPQNIVSSNYK